MEIVQAGLWLQIKIANSRVLLLLCYELSQLHRPMHERGFPAFLTPRSAVTLMWGQVGVLLLLGKHMLCQDSLSAGSGLSPQALCSSVRHPACCLPANVALLLCKHSQLQGGDLCTSRQRKVQHAAPNWCVPKLTKCLHTRHSYLASSAIAGVVLTFSTIVHVTQVSDFGSLFFLQKADAGAGDFRVQKGL